MEKTYPTPEPEFRDPVILCAASLTTSKELHHLIAALSKAQGEMRPAIKDAENTFYSTGSKKSTYADLASCWEVARNPLVDNDLAVLQTFEKGDLITVEWETTDKRSGEVTKFSATVRETVIVTTLAHKTGQRVTSRLGLAPRDITAQAVGSVITYGRRYGLSAILGISQADDDDGNAASGQTGDTQTRKTGSSPAKPPKLDKSPEFDQRPAAEREARKAGGYVPGKNSGDPGVKGPPLTGPAAAAQAKAIADSTPGRDANPEGAPINPETQGSSEQIDPAKLEVLIEEALEEMREASHEGRRVGIEQIWNEIKGNHALAMGVWNRMKTGSPDLYTVMKSVLKPAGDTKARGPKQ